jgi:two-component system, OmpR family, alkaline phosphatase synthesis response regulator PhoP
VSTQRVLVIEDDEVLRSALVEYLADVEGFEVAQAENGEAGLASLELGPLPGAVLVDSFMPVLDGPATIERMRANPAWASIPVILSSGDPRSSSVAADRWLAKPYDIEDLVATLHDVLDPAKN